jgi:hypothetical protein
MGQDVEVWKRELGEAGWTAIRHDVWKAPCGCLYRGPWRAWVTMLAMKANMILEVLPRPRSRMRSHKNRRRFGAVHMLYF